MRWSPCVGNWQATNPNILELIMNKISIKSCAFSLAYHHVAGKFTVTRQVSNRTVTLGLAILGFFLATVQAGAQVNGVGAKPYLGWSTYSEQTIVPSSSV